MATQAYVSRETEPSLDSWLQELSTKAHHESVATTVPEIAKRLQDLLGQPIVAYMSGVRDPKAVGRWSRAERSPRGDSEQRLRAAFQIARLIALAESDGTARAWFIGMNPHLRDRAPFAILGEAPEQGSDVLNAAKAFVAGS